MNFILKYKNAFTIVELIVVITILAILGSIGFSSFSDNVGNARDSQRQADLSGVMAAMKVYKQQKGIYPVAGDNFSIKNGATNIVGYQGKLNRKVPLSTLESLPTDPKLKIPYLYSTTATRKEMQIAGTLENGNNPIAISMGDYKTVSINILPTILLATESDIDVSSDNTKFIYNNLDNNLPYNFSGNTSPTSEGTDFSTLLNTAISEDFWQNSSYRSCAEIQSAGKSIGNGEYQILGTSGTLENTTCSF